MARLPKYTRDELIAEQERVLAMVEIAYELMPDPSVLRNYGQYDKETGNWKGREAARYRQARIIPFWPGSPDTKFDFKRWPRNPGVNLAWLKGKWNPSHRDFATYVETHTGQMFTVGGGNASSVRIENADLFWLLDKQAMGQLGLDTAFERKRRQLRAKQAADRSLSQVLRDLEAMGQDT